MGQPDNSVNIGGTLVAHNCFQFDYCLQAALDSLLPVCSHVVVMDAESTDNTSEWLREYACEHNKVEIIQADWKPNEGGLWLSELGNIARLALGTPYHFHLQADEVLHENSYAEMQRLVERGVAANCKRYNFWLDHKHTVPDGRVCGHIPVRLAPWDAPLQGDSETINADHYSVLRSEIEIFHYGFIRDPKAWADKSQLMQEAFNAGSYDPIIEEVRESGISALVDSKKTTAVARASLVEFNKPHPTSAKAWLAAHGYL